MATFHVQTQTIENYGAHAESGKLSDDNSYWKFKGAHDYVIHGISTRQQALAYISLLCSKNNSLGYVSYPADCQEVAMNFQTERELDQLEYEGKITYPAERFDVQIHCLKHNIEF